MNNKTEQNNRFRQWLSNMIKEQDSAATACESTGDTTAAILAKIRRNVAEIFLKMFDLGAQSSVPAFNPEIREILNEKQSLEVRQRVLFQHYLRMIPLTWEQSLEEAIRHADLETEMKERVKLEMRDVILDEYRTIMIHEPEWRNS